MTTATVTQAQHNGHKPVKTERLNNQRDRDEFDLAAFEEQRESLPYLQMLNHQDPTQSGFFITLENVEAAHFTPTEEWTEHLAVFQNGQTAEGYRSLTARFLILRKSKLLMFARGVAVVGFDAYDPIGMAGGHQSDFATEFVALVDFTLRNAFHFWSMNAVTLVGILSLLSMNLLGTFDQGL